MRNRAGQIEDYFLKKHIEFIFTHFWTFLKPKIGFSRLIYFYSLKTKKDFFTFTFKLYKKNTCLCLFIVLCVEHWLFLTVS